METSIFIARLLGPTFLVIGAGLLADRDGYRQMAREFIASRPLIYIAGLIAFTLGLVIVLVHNVWSGWPVIVTLFGWVAMAAGVVRIVFPARASAMGARMLENPTAMTIAAVVYVVLGLLLSWLGYFG